MKKQKRKRHSTEMLYRFLFVMLIFYAFLKISIAPESRDII